MSDEKRLYTVSVRHIGGSDERECTLEFTILSNDRDSAVNVAKRQWMSWMEGRIEATVKSEAFLEVEKLGDSGLKWTEQPEGMTGSRTYPPGRP